MVAAGGLATNAQNAQVEAKSPDEARPDKSIYDFLHPTQRVDA